MSAKGMAAISFLLLQHDIISVGRRIVGDCHDRCAVGRGADDGAGRAIGRRSVGCVFRRVGTVEERIACIGSDTPVIPARPLSGAGLAGRNAWLVGIKAQVEPVKRDTGADQRRLTRRKTSFQGLCLLYWIVWVAGGQRWRRRAVRR